MSSKGRLIFVHPTHTSEGFYAVLRRREGIVNGVNKITEEGIRSAVDYVQANRCEERVLTCAPDYVVRELTSARLRREM